MKSISIFLIVVTLVAGIVGCGPSPTPQHNLSTNSTEGGSVTTPGEGTFTYDEGTVISLIATPNAGYRFVHWTGYIDTVADREAAATTITMNASYFITANFVAVYDLVISATTGGNVTSPGEGAFAYDTGAVVSLSAAPDTAYQFVNWFGDVDTVADVYDPTTTITMNGDYSISANFTSDNIALSKPTVASSWRIGYPPENAVDGTPAGWCSGDWVPGWIEVDLQDTYNIGRIRLTVGQDPAGETVHQVLGKGPGTGGEFQLLHEFHGWTESHQLLEYIPATPWEGIQLIRIETIVSPSWVAWREIEIWQP